MSSMWRDVEPTLAVGFDFSFSLPAWFLAARELPTADALWDEAARSGETWLAECEPPFWGRAGVRRPDLPAHFRRTEADLPMIGGTRVKSTFQVGGAGSVGTGSIRGFPVLARLRAAGFRIWPFHDVPMLPVAVEIYPRVFTGPVVKSHADARRAFVETERPRPRRAVPARRDRERGRVRRAVRRARDVANARRAGHAPRGRRCRDPRRRDGLGARGSESGLETRDRCLDRGRQCVDRGLVEQCVAEVAHRATYPHRGVAEPDLERRAVLERDGGCAFVRDRLVAVVGDVVGLDIDRDAFDLCRGLLVLRDLLAGTAP